MRDHNDAKHLLSLVEKASEHGRTIQVMTDPAYDSKNNFSYLYHNDIVPAIKVRKNVSGKSGECYPRKISVISQITNYNYYKDSVSYGKRWTVESVFSVLRIFGEHVMEHGWKNMVKELELKVAQHNKFMCPVRKAKMVWKHLYYLTSYSTEQFYEQSGSKINSY